jgi:hypothetical protein
MDAWWTFDGDLPGSPFLTRKSPTGPGKFNPRLMQGIYWIEIGVNYGKLPNFKYGAAT